MKLFPAAFALVFAAGNATSTAAGLRPHGAFEEAPGPGIEVPLYVSISDRLVSVRVRNGCNFSSADIDADGEIDLGKQVVTAMRCSDERMERDGESERFMTAPWKLEDEDTLVLTAGNGEVLYRLKRRKPKPPSPVDFGKEKFWDFGK
jgi:hypothetical protein